MTKTLIAAAAALAVSAFSGQAFAAETETVVRAVSASGVDFNNPQAVQSLYARLKRTATAVCDSQSADYSIRREDRACADRALEKAIRSASRPTLTAMHERTYDARDTGFAAQDH